MINSKKEAFSLIEIMVVIAIIGMLVGLIGPGIVQKLRGGQKGANKAKMTNISGALMQFRLNIGRYPNQKEGLAALTQNVGNSPKWDGPYWTKTDPTKDEWDNDLIYNAPPQEFKDQYKYFEIISYGPEGEGSPKDQWQHVGE